MDFWHKKKVLITGGGGLIGSHLAELLVDNGAAVSVVDSLARGRASNLDAVKEKIAFYNDDLSLRENCLRRVEDKEIVFNLVAKVTGIGYNLAHHTDMFMSNLLLQCFPLQAAVERGAKKFIQVSTACVYPHDAKVPTPETEGARGDPEPTNRGYGWAKRMGEKLAEFCNTESRTKVITVRPFNAYGPRDYFDEATSHAIPALIRKVLEGENPIKVWGSGAQSRVFVYARDIAYCMMRIAEKVEDSYPINIGHDREVSIRALVELIQKITGIKNKVDYLAEKPEGYPRRSSDTARLKELIGYVPDTPLEKGLSATIQWYKENKGIA